MISNWKDDLLAEKSLQAVFRASRGLPKSPHNKFIYAVGGIALAAIAVMWLAYPNVQQSAASAASAADIAFDLSVQILGFLIGGFAIFATVTDDKLMIKLAQIKMPKSELSVFKHVFFNFLSVFYIYIITLSLGAFVKLLDGIDLVGVDKITQSSEGRLAVTAMNAGIFCLISVYIMVSVVRLKSFIWNIYQGFIIFLSTSDSLAQSQKSGEQPEKKN